VSLLVITTGDEGKTIITITAMRLKMNPLNPQYLSKKQRVFQKIADFMEKFKDVGAQVLFKYF
jgi:hypothetical protein